MLHELNARMMGDPREALLATLASAQAEIPEALSALAALHAGREEGYMPLRESNLQSGEHFFPHARDVRSLFVFFCQQLHGLWEACQSPQDDLYVASFGVFGILAIQPFEGGSGRTAIDFAQFLLMLRWGLTQPPMDLPSDADKLTGGLFVGLFPACDGASPEAFYEARQSLAKRFDETTLAGLKADKPFQIAAHWLRDALHPEAMPTTAS